MIRTTDIQSGDVCKPKNAETPVFKVNGIKANGTASVTGNNTFVTGNASYPDAIRTPALTCSNSDKVERKDGLVVDFKEQLRAYGQDYYVGFLPNGCTPYTEKSWWQGGFFDLFTDKPENPCESSGTVVNGIFNGDIIYQTDPRILKEKQ